MQTNMRAIDLLQFQDEKVALEKKRFRIYKQIAELRSEGENNFSEVLIELLNQKELLDHQLQNLEEEIVEADLDFSVPVAEYILNMDDEVRVIKIVEPHSANPYNGLISFNSPLASALIKSNGEEVTVKTPAGAKTYKILAKISND